MIIYAFLPANVVKTGSVFEQKNVRQLIYRPVLPVDFRRKYSSHRKFGQWEETRPELIHFSLDFPHFSIEAGGIMLLTIMHQRGQLST